jgi:hypothetical protein
MADCIQVVESPPPPPVEEVKESELEPVCAF